jgi:hypothetical protein
MVKAEFWTDPELLRWPLAKRVFYQGLWAMAEDSGCLEDDPFGWKLQLFPSPMDSDVTLESLLAWRDQMVKSGKLLCYKADGKAYLYLRNFHQHEHPRNPQRPDLPMPKWLRCESVQGVGKDGRRWIRTQYTDKKHSVPVVNGTCTGPVGDQQPSRRRTSGRKNDASSPQQPALAVDKSVESEPVDVNKTRTRPVQDAQPRPEYLKVHRGRGVGDQDGHEDKSSVLSALVKDNGDRICWRCSVPITGDDILDDKCVTSKRGIRHAVCEVTP